MGNLTGLLTLIGGASKLATALQGVDATKYETQLAALLADGEKLFADMEALGQQLAADAKKVDPQLP